MNNTLVSIEKFAAFLDGNLSANEMQEISSVISEDPALQEILEISDHVDDMVDLQINKDFEFPIELQEDSFSIPVVSDIDNPGFDMLEQNDTLFQVACICPYPDDTIGDYFSDEISVDSLASEPDSSDFSIDNSDNLMGDIEVEF